MYPKRNISIALFYCQNIPESSEAQRHELEKQFGYCVKFFPVPCSGRIDSLHFLRALEEFADAAYILTCAEGECRYFEGNTRAKKRVLKAREIIESIGLEGERIGIINNPRENAKSLAVFTEEIVSSISQLKPSPVLDLRA